MPERENDTPAPPPSPADRPHDRRAFFRKLVLSGMDHAEDAGRGAARRVGNLLAPLGVTLDLPGLLDGPAGPKQSPDHTLPQAAASPPLRFLRPPGAQPEGRFAELCSQCGQCVKACPAGCIRIQENLAGGLPFIVPGESPCVVCTDLACMHACPSGALQVIDVSAIAMGVAEVNHDTCLRHGGAQHAGEDCELCITQCPLGEAAIGLSTDDRIEIRSGCIGCGVCERACPTAPVSVRIVPNPRV